LIFERMCWQQSRSSLNIQIVAAELMKGCLTISVSKSN
jgi:hypothetical protein